MADIKAARCAEAQNDSDKARGTTFSALQQVSILKRALEQANHTVAEQVSSFTASGTEWAAGEQYGRVAIEGSHSHCC